MESTISNSKNNHITYKAEVGRKIIHLLSLLIPIIYAFVNDRVIGLSVMIPIMIFTLVINFVTNIEGKHRAFLMNLYGDMLREHEITPKWYMLNGASFVLVAATISLAIFPVDIFLVAFSVLVISDTSAALFGRRFGKRKLLGNKTYIGTLAFLLSGCLVALFVVYVREIEPIGILFFFIGVLVGTLGELFSDYSKIDDNFVIPILTGLVSWLLFWAFSIPI